MKIQEPTPSTLPREAQDIELNLDNTLRVDPLDGLTEDVIAGVAISVAMATGHAATIAAIDAKLTTPLSEAQRSAAKTAAILMSMNNIYYRGAHLSGQEELLQQPSRLRMNAIKKIGVDSQTFEAYSLAVSTLNGCELCIKNHTQVLLKQGYSLAAIAHILRVTACVNAYRYALAIQ